MKRSGHDVHAGRLAAFQRQLIVGDPGGANLRIARRRIILDASARHRGALKPHIIQPQADRGELVGIQVEDRRSMPS